MNLKPKDKVEEIATKRQGVVVATHTYPGDIRIVSVQFSGLNDTKWLFESKLMRIP